MAEATLGTVSQQLSSQLKVDEQVSRGVVGLRDDFQKMFGIQDKLMRQMAENAREGAAKPADGPQSATKDDGKGVNPYLAAAVTAVVAFATAIKDYFSKMGKLLKTIFKPITAAIRFVFRNIARAFRTLFKVTGITDKIADISKSIKGVMTGIGTAIRNLLPSTDAITDTFKVFKGYFGRVKNFFSVGGDDALKFLTENSIFRVLKNGFNAIKNLLFGSFDGDDIKMVKNFLGGLGSRVSGFFRPLTEFFGAEGPLGKMLARIKNVFSFASEGSGMMKMFAGVGKVIGKLAWPITVIMAIIDGITGAFAGFVNTEGGILKKLLGGLLGGMSGIMEGIVGMPLDLLKSAVSYIAGMFGFEDVQKALDSFSFVDLIRDVYMSPIVMMKRAFNGLIELIAKAVESVDIPFVDEKEMANKLRGFKFETTGESRTEQVARKKGEAVQAKALEDKQNGFLPEKYDNEAFAKKKVQLLRKKGENVEITTDSEGNYRIRKKGPNTASVDSSNLRGSSRGRPMNIDPVVQAPSAPIALDQSTNTSNVAGGTTVMAGETRPSTANDRVMKTGFMQPVYG